MPDPVGYLVRSLVGKLVSFPFGPGLHFRLLQKGASYSPLPGPPLSASPPPGGVGSGRSALGAPLPVCLGSPPFVFSSFPPSFSVSVLCPF